MNEIINRSWLKLTAFVLCCFLNVSSNAQDNGLDVVYSGQSTSGSEINFQKTGIKTNQGIFRSYHPNLKILLPDLRDTFLPNQSHLPLLRNENAGMQKKIGRAELLIGGAELVGITALILLPKDVTKWSDDWA